MALKRVFPSTILPVKNYTTEQIITFLNEENLEKEFIKITPYLLPYEEYNEDEINFISQVDTNVFKDVFNILTEHSLQDHAEHICSILKRGYVNKILAEKQDIDLSDFNVELSQLFASIKNSEIIKIDFISNLKGFNASISCDFFVKAIVDMIKQNMLATAPLYILTHNENRRAGRPTTKVNLCKKFILFDLLYYLYSQTTFIEIPIDFEQPTVDNYVSKMIAELFECSHLEDEVRWRHQPTNAVNRRISRLLLRNRAFEAYLKKDFTFEYDDEDLVERLNQMGF